MITINEQRWEKFSLCQKLGHIGSEISRARHWEKQNETKNRDQALERAIELLDLSISVISSRGRLRELLRLREVMSDGFLKEKNFAVPLEEIEEYCLMFAFYSLDQE